MLPLLPLLLMLPLLPLILTLPLLPVLPMLPLFNTATHCSLVKKTITKYTYPVGSKVAK